MCLRGNVWLEAREREAKEDFSRGTLARHLADNFGNGLSSFFPLLGSAMTTVLKPRKTAQNAVPTCHLPRNRYLKNKSNASVEDLFHHVLAVPARPCLPRGQRRGTSYGLAAHPAARLAGRRCFQGG